MVAPCREMEPRGRFEEQPLALGIGCGEIVKELPIELGSGADAAALRKARIACALPRASRGDACRDLAVPSAGGGSARSAGRTAGTSMSRSMRSKRGSEIFA